MGQPQRPESESLPVPGREMLRWPLLAWLLPLLPLGVLIDAQLQPERRIPLLLQPQIAVTSAPFLLEPGPWGAPLLDLQVSLPPNSSASYDVNLLDGAQKPQLLLNKQAWREVSAWQEEGESGIEDLADTQVRLDLRPQQRGLYQLQVELQELLDAAGRPLAAPLQASLRVRNHVLDSQLLLLTTLVTTLLVGMALRAFSNQGRQRQVSRREDRHLDARLVMGGTGLVRLQVVARYEGGLASEVLQGSSELELMVCDEQGRRIMRRRLPLSIRRRSSDGKHWWSAAVRLHLRFETPESRRLRVLMPQQLSGTHASLEWAEITVLDGCRVLWPQPVLQGLSPAA